MDMGSLPAANADIEAKAARIALIAAANTNFIALTDGEIALAIAQGKDFVSVTTFGHVSPKDILEYYRSFGYKVFTPNHQSWWLEWGGPSNLFGWQFRDYWLGLWPFHFRQDHHVRLIISWRDIVIT